MSTLACNNVAYAYEKGNGILTNISFCFESGKMYAILGPSGSGKSSKGGTCWVPSFDISPRDKWERLAYTRTFAKEVFNDASCHL